MIPNEQLIHTFYTAFKQRDYSTMQACYADHATFSDPVFRDLNAFQVRSMWKMFLVNNKSLTVDYGDVKSDGEKVTARWTADYVLTSTGNQVNNKIVALLTIEKGKITEHVDSFNFYRWASQALGTKGILLGWTPFVKRNVQRSAMASLQGYIRHQADK